MTEPDYSRRNPELEPDSLEPEPKVATAGAAGAAAVVLVFVAGQAGLEITPEVAAAFTTLAAFFAGYFKRG